MLPSDNVGSDQRQLISRSLTYTLGLLLNASSYTQFCHHSAPLALAANVRGPAHAALLLPGIAPPMMHVRYMPATSMVAALLCTTCKWRGQHS